MAQFVQVIPEQLNIIPIPIQVVNEPVYRQYKITYLSEECGYASRQGFLNAFKKETGFTPSYFIENLKKDNPEDLI